MQRTKNSKSEKDMKIPNKQKSFGKRTKKMLKKFLKRYKRDTEFQQQVQTYAMFIGTILLICLYYLQTNSIQIYSDDNVIPNIPSTAMLTKLEREQQENLNLEGKLDLLSLKRRFSTNPEEYLAAQKRERKVLSSRFKQCVSYSPTIKRTNIEKKYYTPKKVFDLPVLQRSLHKQGWSETKNLKEASLVLKGQPRVTFRQLNSKSQYYDMVSALGRIGSKKKTQLATLRNHVKKFGCSFESLNIQPKSFDMNRPSECKKFFENPDSGKLWVLKSCKSGEGSKGAGIEVIDNLKKKREEFGECETGAMNYVAQEYIDKPLLLQGSKFDLRAYLFVASTDPYVVYFNPGYIRRSLAEYKPTSTKKDDVLTNYHVQMKRSDFDPSRAMWSFPEFIAYLQEQGLCKACGDIEITLGKIAKLVFDSGREYYKRHTGSFQIVGLDFMFDEFLNVFFIEGNVSPGLGSHNLKWKSKLMDDLVGMMYEQTTLLHETPEEYDMRIGERVYGKNGNYWELIVHEKHEKCNPEYKFNPCTAF
eukprot:maker-scaffold_2-snap-gene-9.4-mRNA-1 protein AED:0.00 eAED:0.00 QI:200/1/1/1/0/0/2/395/530